ncbi:YSIRK-type signal peptide-containing protein, partial [Streptococcus ovuberis]
MRHNSSEQPDKRLRFSIRKFNVGVASVAVAAFFMAGGTVSADTLATVSSSADIVTPQDQIGQLNSEESNAIEAPTMTSEPESPSEVAASISEDSTQAVVETGAPTEASHLETLAEETVANEPVIVRTAATTYKVTYTDVDTSEVVYSRSHSVSEQTTQPKEEPVQFNVVVNSEMATAPALANYRLVNEQDTAKAAVVVERGGKNNLVNFDVRKEVFDSNIDNSLTNESSAFYATDNATLTGSNSRERWGQVTKATAIDAEGKEVSISSLASAINWIDFSSPTAVITNLDKGTLEPGKEILKVGTKYVNEIGPGYVVTAEVVELKPFRINATNTMRPDASDYKGKKVANLPVGVSIQTPSEEWSHLRVAGVLGNEKAAFGSEIDGANIGFTLKITAKYNGKPVAPTVVVADGEEQGDREVLIFKTSGTPFKLFANVKTDVAKGDPTAPDLAMHDGTYATGNFAPITANTLYSENQGNGFYHPVYLGSKDYSYAEAEKWINPDKVTGGLGTQVFGPVRTNIDGNSVPILTTTGTAEQGLTITTYVNTRGSQHAVIGFILPDMGDAPDSYGVATHYINKTKNPNPPYLGTVPGDVDISAGMGWNSDDLVGGDEGNQQLTGRTTLPQVDGHGKTYNLTILANGNGETAYTRGFIDFNNNGVFDENEASDIVTVNQNGSYTLSWNKPDIKDTNLAKLGARIRISRVADEISSPVGVAGTGEVEDFQIPLGFPPIGERKETEGLRGQEQKSKVNFTAYGKLISDGTTDNSINSNVAVQIVNPSGQLVSTWKEPGQGTYTVKADGTVTFIPEASFTGTAKGIVLRATDKNGFNSGWTADKDYHGQDNVNNGTHTAVNKSMDSVYVPTVKDFNVKGTTANTTGVQGVAQNSPSNFVATIVDDNNRPISPENITITNYTFEGGVTRQKIENEGTYTLDSKTGQVTFTPEPSFTGTGRGIKVIATATVTSSDGTTATKTATNIYTPTVTPVKPTGKDSDTTNVQGQPQTSNLIFKEGDKTAPITITDKQPAKFIDPTTGKETDQTQLPALKDGQEVGTYTIDPKTGQVTFQPKLSFVGTPDAVIVQVKDKNGTPAKAIYTPTVTPVKPTGEAETSTGKQGQEQSRKLDFTPGHADVPMKIDTDQPAKFLDEENQPINETTVPAKDTAGNVIGEFELNPLTGDVTFKPNKDYTGEVPVQPIKVQAKDVNGTPAESTYTPTVTPVKPTGEDSDTTNVQGQPQTSNLIFKEGDKTAPITITDKQPAKFIDPTTGKETDRTQLPALKDDQEVGTYTIDPKTGQVTFQPKPSFVGTPDAVIVQVKDKNGTPATAIYTPTVTAVTPTVKPATTSDIQGQPQKTDAAALFTPGSATTSINPDSIFLVGKDGAIEDEIPALDKDGKQVGTYIIDNDNVITFQPNADFVGTPEPAIIRAKDTNGTEVKTTYTPTVTPVTPSAESKQTTAPQGKPQSAKIPFTPGNEKVPMDDSVPATFTDGTTSKTIQGEGTYEVAPDGTVTFTPDSTFTGKGTGVEVKRVDKNGTPAKAIYTPTVTPVKPTGEAETSTGKQGQEQSRKLDFTPGHADVPMKIDADQPAKFLDEKNQPINETKVPAKDTTGNVIGEFELNPLTGDVTFKPNKDYIGEVPVQPIKVQAKDVNGTPAESTYTPTVTPVTPTAEPATTKDKQGVAQNTDAKVLFTAGDAVAPINNDSITLLDAQGNPTNQPVPAMKDGKQVGTYTLNKETGTITFQPNPDFVGTPEPVNVQAADKNGTTVKTTYTPTVTPVNPTGKDSDTTNVQGQPQTSNLIFEEGDKTAPITITDKQPAKFIDPTTGKETDQTQLPALKDDKEVGTYTIDPKTGQVTFQPKPSFVGTPDAVIVQVKDKNGTPATAIYTPTVTAVTPTVKPATTSDIQGQPQTTDATALFTPGSATTSINPDSIFLVGKDGAIEDEIPALDKDGKQVGTYIIDNNNVITFQPNTDFVGTPEPAIIRAKDTNGTEVKTTYTPMVTPVTPSAESKQTTAPQGKPQSAKIPFTPGNEKVPMDDSVPATFTDGTTSKTIQGEGTYKVAPDGTVTFTPDSTFTGKGTGVEVKRVDKNGTPAKAIYTPTVTPVTPKATPATTEDKQGVAQNTDAKVLFTAGDAVAPINNDSITLLDAQGNPTNQPVPAMKDGKQVGTYTLNKETGNITFQPNPDFIGTPESVNVQAADKNGTTVKTTYTPTVTPVNPTGKDSDTTNVQGQPQTSNLIFKEGDKTAPITITDKQPAKFIDPTTGKETDRTQLPALRDGQEVGTYTIDPKTGQVTFQPKPSFVGTPDAIIVQVKDKNGTPATAIYTPTVTPVTPTATPATTEDKQGVAQNTDAKVLFTAGDAVAPINSSTITLVNAAGEEVKEIVVPGEGTYTLKEDGTIDFTPEPQFTGVAKPVTVKAQDKNGTPVKTTYTPTVTPVTPTATPAITEDKQGVAQTTDAKVLFTAGDAVAPINADSITLLDAQGNPTNQPVPAMKDGQQVGTYTLDKETGTITFQPNPDFIGTPESVNVQAADKNGTTVKTTYTPTVTPLKTSYITDKGQELAPTEEGILNPKTFDAYYLKGTEKDSDGNMTHIYVPKITNFVDENGTAIKPSESGSKPNEPISGYEIVSTTTDKDGNVTNIYRQVTPPVKTPLTNFVDENGTPIKDPE